MSKPIQIWKFADAPEQYSKHFDSDDADWLAFIPKKYAGIYIPFIDGEEFGCCTTEEVIFSDGVVKVGYHA